MNRTRLPKRDRAGRVGLTLANALLLAVTSCTGPRFETVTNSAKEQLEETLFPDYVEVCALSDLVKKPGFGVPLWSGFGGHAVMYLNGVCRDEGAGYPTVKLCDSSSDPEHRGVGISINAHYKNAVWVATPGRNFFYHGDLAPGERLTAAAYRRTQAEAQRLGILDGVEFQADVFDDLPNGMSRRDYMYEISVATDYAIGFGRDRYCARVPLDRDRMGRIVKYLNDLNAPYKDGRDEFNWNILNNNCSHIAHNALAIAGVWDEWPTGRFLLIAAFDFPVPKNEFVNLMRRTNDMPIDDLDAVYDDDAARHDLLQVHSLPTQPGALAEAEHVVADNDIYETDLRIIFYDEAIIGRYRRRFEQIFTDPRYFDLRTNLQYFRELYDNIEAHQQPLAAFLARHGGAGSDEPARFYQRYYAYILQMRRNVTADLSLLSRSDVAHAEGRP